MHDHTTKAQVLANRRRQNVASVDRASDRITGQVHRGQGSEEQVSPRSSDNGRQPRTGTSERPVGDKC